MSCWHTFYFYCLAVRVADIAMKTDSVTGCGKQQGRRVLSVILDIMNLVIAKD